MVSVIYRIRNRAAEPVNAYGVVRLLPGEAGRQVEFFLIECGGEQTFAAGAVRDYQVVFQVRPESAWVTQAFTVQHTFTPATTILP
jgi:cytochrome c oxidase assembly protein Cox11